MNKNDKRLILWLLIYLFFIYLVHIMFTFDPEVVSGNGNPALLLLPPTIISFAYFSKSLWSWLGTRPNLRRRWMISISLIVLAVASFLEYQFVTNLIHQLGGPPSVETSRIYRYPWLNQYTNTMFVNVYTFLIMVSIVAIVKVVKKRKT